MKKEMIVSVFGSSRPREDDPEYAEARKLGRSLAKKGFAICTGAYGGTMEAVSRGAKEAGGKTYGVTAEFFVGHANEWIDVEVRKKTWQERLFSLIELADGFVACKGGTGTLAELAVAWEMLNKAVMPIKPFAVCGDFWQPILQRVREVEQGKVEPGKAQQDNSLEKKWGEASGNLVHSARTPQEAAKYIAEKLKEAS